LVLWCLIFLNSIFLILIPCQMNSWQRYSPFLEPVSTLVIVSFVVQKPSKLMQLHLAILTITSWAIRVLFRKSLSMPVSWSIFPMLFFSSFKSYTRSLINFELIFVQGERQGSSFSLLLV
jgi:hypothetical protein